ncbi:hypothetical protein CXK86_08105 [Paenibacillus sp. BGI2013]|uniref:hypothetical protein n=1 Tax=Paenibacillus TaxID=44249 RepID=UPI00096CBDB3|nr:MULTISPECIES: hypothetical protein [Paenibacillus]OMF45314.1 hypothetical protein BK136_09415 [Paenibacillus amylolyticus]PKQ91274.1 hypothetical protein CXK86_08105 [Paenibacillus sp. BGI2013]
MPYELGGRSDKSGNKFEIRWTVNQILEVLDERLDYITLEPLGDDEQGVDIWVGLKNGTREAQQCKGRNASKEYWDYGTANAKGIFTNWKFQLERNESNTVSLVSPLAFTLLEDLINRANNTSTSPQDFYQFQILTASKELRSFFENFCKSMELIPQVDHDLIKCISLLKRISYRQTSDSDLKRTILSRINYLFLGDENEIYETLATWVIDGDILGKPITPSVIYQLINGRTMILKNLALDKRIIPRFEELNREYTSLFLPLNNKLIERKEFYESRKAISSGESLIIHGKAGRGKSGCTEDIINYCQENAITFIALKLDKRTPSVSAQKWGEDLGLPSSIVHCIHSVSKTESAVIILDQLDALRWTQAHSRDALLVCTQIIDQVERVNLERENKISVVFVCRTYDLENDNNIKSLFKTDNNKKTALHWNKIQINEFPDDSVKVIVGNRYENLTKKLKEVLRVPSNLYIWKHLDNASEYNECSTANHLVLEWWRQLEKRCFEFGLNEGSLNETKEQLIKQFDKLGRISIPINLLSVNRSSLEFLSSNGFLMLQGNKISFAHQSILDCFLAEMMLKQYYENENILNVIGDKEKQTPGRRYQVQMMLQNLVEFDSADFLVAGQKILASENIRYSVKFVFFEILNQLEHLDRNVQNYIIDNCENEMFASHIINNVVNFKPQYINLLRNKGILDRWFEDTEKKQTVINLIISKSPEYEVEDALFIEKHAFQSQEDDTNFMRCFLHDINMDIDEMFELRMKFYRRYPNMAENYLDFKAMLRKCEMRTIRVFAFLLENKLKRHAQTLYRYEEEFLLEDSEFLIQEGSEVINLLLPFVPTIENEISSFNDWSARYSHINGLERACIQIIKKANTVIILSNPKTFWERYKGYMGKGNDVYNEIILDAMIKLPYSYSDAIVEYLCSDFENNIFDKTSGNGDQLLLAKQVMARHSEHCSLPIFELLEKTVISYVSPLARRLYQRRIEYNRENNGSIVYWSFWGDLQKEILEALPLNQLSKKARDLIHVLRRRYKNETTLYMYSNGHSGSVSSPIAGKKLSDKRWIAILTNQKLRTKGGSRWNEVPGGFVESSIQSFSSTFSTAVSEEPERMIKLLLSCNDTISEIYIDTLFNGVAHSKTFKNIPLELLESMIFKFSFNFTSYRANSICTMIEKSDDVGWSQEMLDSLKDIAIKHKNPEIGKPNVTNNEDKEMRSFEMLQSNAINCVRGEAAQAIANLLWKKSDLFSEFKDTIEKLVFDENPAVRYASLFALWPSYNIDRDWASEKILYLYEQDYRLAGFHDTRNMFFWLYPRYRQRIINIIKQCYDSEDDQLIRSGAHCLSEMFIIKNDFVDEMANVDNMSKLQAEEIIYMVMLYFDKEEYNSLAKNIILKFKTSTLDLEMPISRLFYDNLIDLERDKDFLIELMSSDLSRRTLHAFVNYLEEEAKSVVEFKDIILSMSRHLIQNDTRGYEGLWGIHDDISKLVIGLYDETTEDTRPEIRCIAQECLDIWDLMFEKQIGPVRRLSHEMMQR